MNLLDNHCWPYYNGLILLPWFLNDGSFTIFTLIILFSVLLSTFSASSAKCWKQHPDLALNVVQFSLLLIHILISELSVNVSCFWWYSQNNLQYLIQNLIYQVFSIYNSTKELVFSIYCFYVILIYFPNIVDAKIT